MPHLELNKTSAKSGPVSEEPRLQVIINDCLHGFGLRRDPSKYKIFGWEFLPRDKLDAAANVALSVKEYVEQAVRASPEASIIWAGVCIVLPLLTSPMIADEANRDGFAYVTSRISFWAALQSQIFRPGTASTFSPAVMFEVESHFVSLYRHFLEFQVRTVLRCHRRGLSRYLEDISSPSVWKELISAIKDEENRFGQDLQNIRSIETAPYHSLSAGDDQESLAELQNSVQQVADAIRMIATEKEKECLHLFRLTDSTKDVTYEWYKNRVEDRVENTCKWVLQHDNFKAWLEAESGPLLVSADPGCGKSVLSKYLIDKFLPTAPSTRSATLCYFFFKDGDQNTMRQALCALLHQLFSQKGSLVKHALEQYHKNGKGLIHSTTSLWRVLFDAVQDEEAGPVIIVLDALDECLEIECEDLISNIARQFHNNRHSSSGQSNLRILLTSRPYDQIVDKFHAATKWIPFVRIPGEQKSDMISEEINHVIRFKTEQFADEHELQPNVKDALEKQLLTIQHRTYLWIYLVFDYLRTSSIKKTPKGIIKAIEQLPKDVNEAYERILHKSRDQVMARKAFRIILAALRPLTVSEMNIAVNIDCTAGSLADLDEDDQDFEKRLRSSCGLFVSIHHGKVYFLHQTAREFLLSDTGPYGIVPDQPHMVDIPKPMPSVWKNSFHMADAHGELLTCCVHYLNLLHDDASLVGLFGKVNPEFCNYSAGSWSQHFQHSYEQVATERRPKASGSPAISTWSSPDIKTTTTVPTCVVHAPNIARPPDCSSHWNDFSRIPNPVQQALSIGADAIIIRATNSKTSKIDGNCVDGRWTSVQVAPKPDGSVLALFLRRSLDADEYGDKHGVVHLVPPMFTITIIQTERTLRPLAQAGLLRLASDELLARILSWAVTGIPKKEAEASIKMLLEDAHTSIINYQLKEAGCDALCLAVQRLDLAMVKLLLDQGANIDVATDAGLTPLILAVKVLEADSGHERHIGAIIQLLVQRGANLGGTNEQGDTALHALLYMLGRSTTDHRWAVIHELVEMIITAGSSLEAIGRQGRTPFAVALGFVRPHGTRSGTLRIILQILEKWAITTASGTCSYGTATRGPVIGSVQNEDMWPNRNALHLNGEAMDRLFEYALLYDSVAELVRDHSDFWRSGVKSTYAEKQRRLKRGWFDPNEGPIQEPDDLRGLLTKALRLLFNKGYGAKVTDTMASRDPSSEVSPHETGLWRRAEESGLIYAWDEKRLNQLTHRYVSPDGVYPEGTDYLSMVLERSSGYLRRRTSQELLNVMEVMTWWERWCLTDPDRCETDSDDLKALECWFTDRNLGSEFGTDGSRHILLYRENVPPAPPPVVNLGLPSREQYQRLAYARFVEQAEAGSTAVSLKTWTAYRRTAGPGSRPPKSTAPFFIRVSEGSQARK